MGKTKVRYLYKDRDHYRYQRRVPESVLSFVGLKMWKIGLGSDYMQAVADADRLAREHDDLIRRMRDPNAALDVAERIVHDESTLPGTVHQLRLMADRNDGHVTMRLAAPVRPGDTGITLEPDIPDGEMGMIRWGLALADGEKDPAARLVILHRLLAGYFGDDAPVPDDPDARIDHRAMRDKIKARIDAIQPDTDTITTVLERYIVHQGITPNVALRYRRYVGHLTDHLGSDMPISQITPRDLRRYRTTIAATRAPATVKAMFTPLKGLLRFAEDEDLIEANPARSIRMPRERLSVEDRSYMPFSPAEVRKILSEAPDYYRAPRRFARWPERCHAYAMLTRAAAFTGCRPVELVRLTPKTVSDEAITIRESKTASSSRVIPLHPEIANFPDFVRSGGLKTFDLGHRDPAIPFKRTHATMLRDGMGIDDSRKCLYSWRATFQNAMERAGIDKDVRQAILGHVEGGAIRRYSAGPEWYIKVDAVHRTDPRQEYQGMSQDR